MPEGSTLPVPAVAGSDRADMRIDLYLEPKRGRTAVLELTSASGEVIGRAPVDQFGRWTSVILEDVPWPTGEPPALSFRGPPRRRKRNYSAIFDRATFTWHPARHLADE